MPEVHDIRAYEAVLDGLTVNDAAIHRAVAAMLPGHTLLIPPGQCRINNLVLNVPDDCTVECQGTFVTAPGIPGTAVRIGQTDAIRFRLAVEGLKVVCDGLDWSAGRVGVQIVNVYESVLDLRRVERFNTNVLLCGTANVGCVYNEIHLGRLVDGQTQVKLVSDTGGWCTENHFYGGRIAYSSSIADTSGCTGIICEHDAVNTVNNNRFYAPSIEAHAWGGIPAVRFEGSFNSLLFPRLEQIGPVVFGFNSAYCTLMFGYGAAIDVQDQGVYNKMFTNSSLHWSSGAGAGAPVIQAQSGSSNKAHLYSAQDVNGKETAWINGDGTFWTQHQMYAAQGFRWSTSDGTYRDRGLFVGTGSPEGVVTAAPGSVYSNRDGGAAQTLWVKQAGSDAFGWCAVA